jgi:hypothetical protein
MGATVHKGHPVTLSCGAGLEGASGLTFSYWATIFADGTVWASAEIVDSFTATSGSRIYAANQNGALTASVQLTRDAATPSNGGWWDISVTRQTLVVNIVYRDVDVANGQVAWTLDSSSNGCVVNPRKDAGFARTGAVRTPSNTKYASTGSTAIPSHFSHRRGLLPTAPRSGPSSRIIGEAFHGMQGFVDPRP